MSYTLRTVPDPILEARLRPLECATIDLAQKVDTMYRAMVEFDGVGLAANQIGYTERMFVYGLPGEEPKVLINPEIVGKSKETEFLPEGCLSIPGSQFFIKRHTKVVVHGRNYNFEEIEVGAKGFLAQIFQHEIDHLDGKHLLSETTLI